MPILTYLPNILTYILDERILYRFISKNFLAALYVLEDFPVTFLVVLLRLPMLPVIDTFS
nr:MAG TPA: hypothetical protein [Caudoviricetes sp.]